ncbi:MAG TPA: TIGR00341 family protein [Anaerolineae bacterium]|nr:TIGR00341 family protein [Anaerolineae bacterium]MCB0223596.1 TIGR00341 family protein [Anaerolineae bacterium]HRV92665.1 TIGR00341 family protein [Anaerolineae bacterium]
MLELLKNIIQDNKFTPGAIPPFEEKLFFEGAKRRINTERFAVLLFLSTVIATYGVLGDSTATVIGAMIIAPLMTPIMATAAGLVMGDMRRAGRSFLTVVAGVVSVILTAWFIGTFLNTTVVSFSTNSQIVSRVSPSLTDLAVALASGAAGAFAMSRDDVADSLPGVAISIALVPPLAVVGIALSHGQWANAWGALLLFLTNFLSILLAGGGTLALLGLSAASTKELKSEARRQAFFYIAIGTLLVAIPLGSTSYKVAQDTLVELRTQQFMQQWLAGTKYETTRVKADGDQVEIVVNGSGPPPPFPDSSSNVPSELNGYELEFRVMPSEVYYYPEPTPDPSENE